MSLTPRPIHLAIGALLLATAPFVQAAGMQVSSASFNDGGSIPALNAGSDPQCGGQGHTPQVAWKDLPAGTRSVAITLVDPDGAKGLGVNHWVVYNIAAQRGELKEDEARQDIPGVSVGKNSAGLAAYRGMCPPPGDRPHHFILTVIATDIEPGTLAEGLSHDELMGALKGHSLAGQSVVGRYGR